MAKIKAEYGAMISAADRLRNSAKNVSSMYDEVTRILKNMPLSTNYYRGVQGKMLLQSESIQQTGKKLETAAGAVEQIVSMYKAADLAAANGTAVAYAKANANILGGMAGLFDDKSWLEKVAGIVNGKMTISKMNGLALLGGLALASPALSFMGLYGLIQDNGTYEKPENAIHLFKGQFKFNALNKLNSELDDYFKDKGWLNKKASNGMNRDFEILSFEQKKSVSLFHDEVKYPSENGRFLAKGSYDIFNAEGVFNNGLGKFSYKDENGKRVNGLGIYSEIGASIAAAKTKGELRYGSDLFDIHTKGEAKLLSAAAKAECIAAWTGKGPQLKFGGRAEANIFELAGSVGTRIMGTDVDAELKLKGGLGVVADIGYKDGELTMNFGGSLGVGAEVALKLDMSGTIDFVKENADNFKSWANDTSKAIGDAWDTTTTVVSDFVDDVGDSIDKGFKKAGKTIEKAGDVIGDAFHGLGDLIGG